MKKKSFPAGACVSLAGILLLLASALFAGWLAPYDRDREMRREAFHPPTQIHFVTEDGKFSLRPFVYATRMRFDGNYRRIYEEDKSRRYPVRFGGRSLFHVEEPASLYLLGTDSRGRDFFSRILFGARISLSIGILGAAIAALLGLFFGGLAGYFGGAADQVIMRISEFFIMIPGFYFLLALRSVLPPDLGSREIYVMIVLILSFIGWGGMARVIRGMVLSLRENDFVPAAKVLGRGHLEILVRHILPHTFSYVLIVVSISIPGYILGESALSILGLGIQDPDVSWGMLLTEALSIAHLQLHPWVLSPGIFIFIASLCFHTFADSLQGRRRVV